METTASEPERIYIGGLDPPRLTAQDVLDRFQSMTMASKSNIEIQTVESKPDKPYCHVTAVSKNVDDESPSSSALQVLVSTFNNVKWKGCRLSVQAARPHFLELLEQERQERRQQQQQQQAQHSKEEPLSNAQRDGDIDEVSDDKQETTLSLCMSKIPRRLRIRKKFGDAAYHVDQKPWSVDNWPTFTHAMGKQRKRVEKYEQEKKASSSSKNNKLMIMPAPLMHRAVHIRFDGVPLEAGRLSQHGQYMDDDDDDDDDDDTNANENGDAYANESSEEEGSPVLMETSDDSSASSNSESDNNQNLDDEEEEEDKKASAQKASYAWSDEEEEEDDEDDDDDERSVERSAKDDHSELSEESEVEALLDLSPPSREKGTDHHHHEEEEEESDAGSYPDSTKEELLVSTPKDHVTEPAVQDPPIIGNTQYQWSSDEESSDEDDDEYDSKYRNRPLVPVTQSDEFAAGLDLDDGNDENREDDGNDHQVDPLTKHTSPKDEDLSNDVTANLSILSSLFPEVAEAQPAVVKPSGDLDAETEKATLYQTQTGFGASGIMLRYDPNDVSTQRFEIVEEKVEPSPPIAEKEDADGTSPSSSDDESSVAENARKDQSAVKGDIMRVTSQDQPVLVYEQKKLEDVFREARETWEGGQPAEKAASSAAGAFSFGFDLGAPEAPSKDKSQASGGFSFGFSLPETLEPNATTAEENGAQDKEDSDPVSSEKILTPVKVPEKRIRGFLFPNDVIEKDKANFFAANNGNDIMKDAEAFRSDPKVKEAWTKERQALTLDWKRKRKHAQSRIQKRMKIR